MPKRENNNWLAASLETRLCSPISRLLGGAIPRTPKILEIAKKAKKANHLQGANAQSATTKAYSTTMARAKKGGRRWSLPGGLQSAAHRRCAKRAGS